MNYSLVFSSLHTKKIGRIVQQKKLSLGFSPGFFYSKQALRKFPVQAALHRVVDGCLVGVLIIVAIMSSVALHSQYLWAEAFKELEITRDLNRRIFESTGVLESYLLKDVGLSKYMVPTKVKDLVYVDLETKPASKLFMRETFKKRFFKKISSYPIKQGY